MLKKKTIMSRAQNSNYNQLIARLDKFIRKYYINSAIKGFLVSSSLALALFVLYTLLEHFFYFGTGVRAFLFYSFIGVVGLFTVFLLFAPLLKYFNLGKVISHEQAAAIIGTHFSEVQDKLLNILQLKQQAERKSSSLLLAGIEQKTLELNPVPFQSAIDLSQNKKYIRYLIPPLFIILGVLVVAPSLITESTSRIIQNSVHFERPAPFQFTVTNEDLSVMQFESFEIKVSTAGEVQPAEAYIDLDGYQYRMKNNGNGNFSYTLNNIQSNTSFRLVSGPVKSKIYEVEVNKKPRLADMQIDLKFPAYTGRESSTLSNVGDITVPQGTEINWTFYTESSNSIELNFTETDEIIEAEQRRPQHFEHSERLMETKPYIIYVSGDGLPRVDSVAYLISVIPDRYPSISVEEFEDEDDEKLRFFAGEATDDYGLREISFHYQIRNSDGTEQPMQKVLVDNPGQKNAEFVFNWDVQPIGLQPGDEVTYYFQASDNDGVNGSKTSRTGLMTYRIKSLEEIEEMAQENTESIKENLSESQKENQSLQEEIKKMQDKLLDKKDMDWQDRRDLEQLLQKKEELEKMVEEARKKHKENLRNQEEHMPIDEDLAEKQKKLEELFDQMVDDEMKSLMEQIRDMLDELTREEAMEMLREMEMSEENMQMNLDRMNELFKSLEVEMAMKKNQEELEKLAKELEELSEETASGETSSEELKEKQDEIAEAFEELKEDLEEMREKNEQLERPHNLGNQEEMEEEASEELSEGSEKLNQGDNQGASESQEKAGEKMKEMAQSMQSSMEGGQMQQMSEDMASLRKLLDNLISISFDQENLVNNFNRTNINTPRYVDLMREQFQLQNDFKIVEDSLVALSKRVLQLQSFILDKVSDVKRHLNRSVDQLEERRKTQASDDQRRVMTYVNDLALMLNEAMEQMQQQMSGMMPGNQMCQNPGEGEQEGDAPVDKITEGQDQLGEEMKGMQERMGEGQEGSSEEFARMAKEQAELRKMLENLRQQKGEQGLNTSELQEIIDKMNEIETDLVNKRLNSELLERQQDILTRLLRAEQADRERGLDEKRRGEIAQDRSREMPPDLEEYLRERETEINFYRSVAPGLSPYYQYLVDEYYRALRSN